MIINNTSQLIGNTPILKLEPNIYVKLENYNLTGSVKIRIVSYMIQKAKEEKILTPGQTIIEPTSGNTGIALSAIGAINDHPVIIVMPDTMSIERRHLIEAYGAKVILTPGNEGMNGAVKYAEKLAQQNNYFMPMQFKNKYNPEAHEKYTAQEIINDFGTGNLPDIFITGIGTGGTLSGVGKALKKIKSNIKIIGIEPENSPIISQGKKGTHKIQGIGAGFIPDTLDTNIYDDIITVADSNAIQTMKDIAKNQGLLLGISSGANIYGSKLIQKKYGKDLNILTTAPDSGERYLSMNIF